MTKLFVVSNNKFAADVRRPGQIYREEIPSGVVHPRLPEIATRTFLSATVAAYAALWIVSAINPLSRFDWLLENLLVFLFVPLLVWLLMGKPLSKAACIMIFLFLAFHAVGAHFTYSKAVPGIWLQHAFEWERNHFDRVVHFLFGLLAVYPIREAMIRYGRQTRMVSAFLAFAMVATSSTVYELIEWLAAIILSPDAAMAFLGTQGDVFDAQKDSGMALAGAIIGLVMTWLLIGKREEQQTAA